MTERPPTILAIDDDQTWLSQIPLILEDDGEILCCDSIDKGLLALESRFFDIVLLDLNFDGDTRTGLDVFRRIAAIDNSTDVIVISGETQPEVLIQIMNAGVTQFIPKPSGTDVIRSAVRHLLQKRQIKFRAMNLASSYMSEGTAIPLLGKSLAMQKLRDRINEFVKNDIKDVLLTGETGTGKEIVSRIISSLADPAKRIIPIHCGAINDGIAESELFGHVKGAFTGADKERASAFEIACGGFVFLDEIGEMPLLQQAKLLRILQERKVQRVGSTEERTVSFKCISATNADLRFGIKERRFREDLFYRIAKVEIHIPALRDRIEDLPEIVHYFLNLKKSDRPLQITDEALSLLQSYSWPGNVRQLQTAVEVMMGRCTNGIIRERDVCQTIPELGRLFTNSKTKSFLGREGAALISAERKRYQNALIDARGSRSRAAEILKISRATFFRRAKELGLTKSVM